MKILKVLLLAAAISCAGSLPALAQGVPAYRAVNSFGVWFWSVNSPQEVIAVCQVNTPQGGTCWYKGFF